MEDNLYESGLRNPNALSEDEITRFRAYCQNNGIDEEKTYGAMQIAHAIKAARNRAYKRLGDYVTPRDLVEQDETDYRIYDVCIKLSSVNPALIGKLDLILGANSTDTFMISPLTEKLKQQDFADRFVSTLLDAEAYIINYLVYKGHPIVFNYDVDDETVERFEEITHLLGVCKEMPAREKEKKLTVLQETVEIMKLIEESDLFHDFRITFIYRLLGLDDNQFDLYKTILQNANGSIESATVAIASSKFNRVSIALAWLLSIDDEDVIAQLKRAYNRGYPLSGAICLYACENAELVKHSRFLEVLDAMQEIFPLFSFLVDAELVMSKYIKGSDDNGEEYIIPRKDEREKMREFFFLLQKKFRFIPEFITKFIPDLQKILSQTQYIPFFLIGAADYTQFPKSSFFQKAKEDVQTIYEYADQTIITIMQEVIEQGYKEKKYHLSREQTIVFTRLLDEPTLREAFVRKYKSAQSGKIADKDDADNFDLDYTNTMFELYDAFIKIIRNSDDLQRHYLFEVAKKWLQEDNAEAQKEISDQDVWGYFFSRFIPDVYDKPDVIERVILLLRLEFGMQHFGEIFNIPHN